MNVATQQWQAAEDSHCHSNNINDTIKNVLWPQERQNSTLDHTAFHSVLTPDMSHDCMDQQSDKSFNKPVTNVHACSMPTVSSSIGLHYYIKSDE